MMAVIATDPSSTFVQCMQGYRMRLYISHVTVRRGKVAVK